MTEATTIDALSDRLSGMAQEPQRCFVALAGPPGPARVISLKTC